MSKVLPVTTSARYRLLLLALMASIALLAVFAWQRQAQAATTLNVTAGFGSGTVAANAYGPGAPTIVVGDSIKWTVGSDEVHSVTFGSNPGGGPPANWPVAGFTAPPPGPPGPVSLGPVTYTGTEFLNTGLMSKGSTATVTFNTAGTFNYFCVIHSGMTGVVNVVASGSATTQAQADSAAASTSSLLLGQVSALRQSTLNSAVGVAQPDGTTRWDIWANGVNPPAAMPGGGTGYLELLEFIPPNLAIKAGDTVHWRATAPHTVTFLAPGQDVDALEAQYGGPTGVPAAKPSSSYDGKSFYNSGPLTLGPTAPKDFSLTFPTQGTFQYLCLFHEESGQIGYITVGASATRLPSTGGAPIQTGSGGSSVPWLVLLAGAGALAIAMGAGGLAFCKVKR